MTFHPTPGTSVTPATYTPTGWNSTWKAARAKAQNSTGVARIAVIGDSWAAGQSSGTVTDCLLYGYIGRLDALLRPQLGSYAQGYTCSGVNNVVSGGLTSPSGPYSQVTPVAADGGVGTLFATSTNGSTFITITAQLDPVTNANPTAMDIFTVDFNTNSWQYTIDGGGAVTITPGGVSGVVGAGNFRRTSLTFTPPGTHAVAIQQNAANALALSGHVTYYGTTGLGIMRAAIPGFKSVDYATGSGTTASSTTPAGNSLTPDHIVPWAGLNSTSSPGPAPPNIPNTLNIAGSYPFGGTDLAIIQLGGNDCLQGSSVEGMRNVVTRFINAFRRSNPATSTSPGCSILMVGEGFSSPYSDYSISTTNVMWQHYKNVLFDLAQAYGCGWLDVQQLFGETGLGRGLFSTSGTQGHPTQNGAGAGGGDGHLTIANAIYGML